MTEEEPVTEHKPEAGPESVELVRRAQNGEDAALNDLFERYYERVRRIVRMRLGQHLRSAMDSGDILQETFIASVSALDRFEMRDESSLIHWLAKIAENQIRAAADFHGAKKRDRRRDVALQFDSQTSGHGRVHEPSAHMPQPLDELARGEDTEAIESALAELREDYREVILHRDYTGATWDAVAKLMGAPSPDASRMLYARAITELSTRVRRRTEP